MYYDPLADLSLDLEDSKAQWKQIEDLLKMFCTIIRIVYRSWLRKLRWGSKILFLVENLTFVRLSVKFLVQDMNIL